MADRFPFSADELVWDFINLGQTLGHPISEGDISREVIQEIVTRYKRDLNRMKDPSIFQEAGYLPFWLGRVIARL